MKITPASFLLLFLAPAFLNAAPPFSGSMLDLAKKKEPEAYRFALEHKAVLEKTSRENSYQVWYQPENFNPDNGIVLVSLHGHEGWAVRDFQVWYPELQKRNYAFLAVQWWYGLNEGVGGYARPTRIYEWIGDALRERGIPPGRVIFHGFSRGSAVSYSVSHWDKYFGNPYFAVTISNAGPFEEDFLPNRAMLVRKEALAGRRWILYCSKKDENPRHGCDAMKETEKTLADFGARIDLFIQDDKNGHGSFMLDSANTDRALNEAEKIIRGVKP